MPADLNKARPFGERIRAQLRVTHPGFTLDVDLDLPGRGITALFGASGSGKTTCLRALAGLERASGYVSLNGDVWQDDTRNTFTPTHRRALGYVFQEASLFPHLSVRGNLEYGMRRAAGGGSKVSLDHAVALLGIGQLLDRMPDKLSGGEKQRVAIARALAAGPRLLLMDEPLAALDRQRKAEILPYLERLHEDLQIPVVYVSHAPDEVARLADHLVVLEQGKAVASGPLSEVLARLDLPLGDGDDAGVVLAGQIVEIDAEWSLARLAFAGGDLWVRDSGLRVGQQVRVRILARDISIALEPHADTSILNVLPATVDQMAEDVHPALTFVRLSADGTPLVARITRRSASRLALRPGLSVWLQIKAVALLA